MILFSVVLLVPLVFVLLAYYLSREFVWQELLIVIGVQIVIAGAAAGICYSSNTSDVETWDGFVTSKDKVWTSCEHSYQCHCHEVCSSGKNRSCSEECDTCYQHANDWNWTVYMSTGDNVDIERIDSRGSDEPPRWTSVHQGEPSAVQHSYTNYIKAAPDTLFRHQGLEEKYKGMIPSYPNQIYDYYRINHLVQIGTNVPNPDYWNHDLAHLNGDLGSSRQSNIMVVLVNNKPDDYYDALEEAWIGGKKNDVILVVSIDNDGHPQWARVMAWTTNPIFKVKLRDSIMALPVIERWSVIDALRANIVAYHHRKPMADFEYLKASITPSTTEWIITLIIGLLSALGLTWYFQANEVFPSSDYSTRSRYY